MTTLDDLIARLEKATGASREMDAEIAVAVGWTTRPGFPYPWLSPDGCAEIACPAYTGSLDAAMTLVPEGWTWLVRGPTDRSTSNRHDCYAHLDRNLEQHGEAFAATGPLALTIAALKARKARP